MISHTEPQRETPDGALLYAMFIYSGCAPENGTAPEQPRVRLEFQDAVRLQVPDPDFVAPENDPDAAAPLIDAVNAVGQPAYRAVRGGRSWSYSLSGDGLNAALYGAAKKTVEAVFAAAGIDPAGHDMDALALTLAQQGYPEQALRRQAEEIEVARRDGGVTVTGVQGDAP